MPVLGVDPPTPTPPFGTYRTHLTPPPHLLRSAFLICVIRMLMVVPVGSSSPLPGTGVTLPRDFCGAISPCSPIRPDTLSSPRCLPAPAHTLGCNIVPDACGAHLRLPSPPSPQTGSV
mmetsp:Transcript_137212/g.238607  ORF Transcript_137212/g.238607 Transcript_137212/m.238607 type:complete len:118 (-) Transcript_137212:162-515(-)